MIKKYRVFNKLTSRYLGTPDNGYLEFDSARAARRYIIRAGKRLDIFLGSRRQGRDKKFIKTIPYAKTGI